MISSEELSSEEEEESSSSELLIGEMSVTLSVVDSESSSDSSEL